MGNSKVIIDSNIFSDFYFRGAKSPDPIQIGDWVTKPINFQKFENLLVNGYQYEHYLIGTQLKKEFSGLCNGGTKKYGMDRGLNFMIWYNNCTQGDKSMKKNFEIDYANRLVKTNDDDEKFDEFLTTYKSPKTIEDFTVFKNKLLSKTKNRPTKCDIDDWHIIAACSEWDIEYVHTSDWKLEFVLLPLLNHYHKTTHKVSNVYGRTFYMDKINKKGTT